VTELFDPFVLRPDPFPAFARARAQGGFLWGVPPFVNARPTAYLFSHRLVDLALRDPRLRHAPPGENWLIPEAQIGPGQHLLGILNRSVLTADPPRHGTLRRPLNPLMNPARGAALRDGLRDSALALATNIARKGHFDAVQEFVTPFSIDVICRLLGIPAPDIELVRKSTDSMVRVIDFQLTEGSEEEACELEAFVTRVIAERRFDPDGMAAVMLDQEACGLWDRKDVIANIMFALFAGHETVIDTFGNALMELDAAPSQRLLLAEGRAGWSATADELLRVGAPIHYAVRIAAENLELGGNPLKSGTMIIIALSSANRDTSIWPAGDRLRLDSPGSVALTFGSGIHACIGRHLARVELAVLLEALFTAAPNWSLDRSSVVARDSFLFRGLVSAPVSMSPAVAA
jgi:cytochrome P450